MYLYKYIFCEILLCKSTQCYYDMHPPRPTIQSLMSIAVGWKPLIFPNGNYLFPFSIRIFCELSTVQILHLTLSPPSLSLSLTHSLLQAHIKERGQKERRKWERERSYFSTTVTLLLEPLLPVVLLLSPKEEIKSLPAKYAPPFCTYCVVSDKTTQKQWERERPSSTSSWHGWLGV